MEDNDKIINVPVIPAPQPDPLPTDAWECTCPNCSSECRDEKDCDD